jgi:hypothetical protein
MAGEEKIQACALPPEVTNGIRSSRVYELKFCVKASLLHSVDKIGRDIGFLAGRAWNVDDVYKNIADAFGRDMCCRLGELRMDHRASHICRRSPD